MKIKDIYSHVNWTIVAPVSIGLFLGFYLIIDIPLIISFLMSGIVFTVCSAMFKSKTEVQIIQENSLEATIQEGEKMVSKIRLIASKLYGKQIPALVEAICEIIEKIFAEVKRDPADLPNAQKIFSYFLPTTIDILQQYDTLTKKGIHNEEFAKSISRTESILKLYEKKLNELYASMYNNDKASLDASLNLLEKTLKSEFPDDFDN